MEEASQIERRCALEHVIDGPSNCMGQDGQRLAWARVFRHAGQQLVSGGMVTQAPRGRFGTGPRAVRVAALRARGPHACASRGLAAFDHARMRGNILDAGQAAAGRDGIAPHEAGDGAHTGYRLAPLDGRSIGLLGGLPKRPRSVTEALSSIGAARPGHRDGLVHGRVVHARRATRPVRVGCAVRADVGQGVWCVGMVHRRHVCGTVAQQRRATPPAVTGAPHRGRIDRGVGPHAAASQRGKRW